MTTVQRVHNFSAGPCTLPLEVLQAAAADFVDYKGMGMSLWQAMLLRHRAEGATFVETTISGHNLPIINLYARLGFSFASAQMTFHRLRDPKQ